MSQYDIYRDRSEEIAALQKQNPLEPLYMVIRDCLKKEIISCRLEPGERIKELELAKACGVSRTTIRNAVDILVLDGLVELNGRNMRVVPLTRAQYTQLHEYRRRIDPIAAEMAADHYTREDLEELRRCLKACESDDAEAFLEADSNFHRAIYAASGNMFLLKVFDQIEPSRRRINYFSVVSISKNGLWDFSHDKRDRMRNEHKAIFDAIARSDAKTAAELAEKHVGSLLFDFDTYEKN